MVCYRATCELCGSESCNQVDRTYLVLIVGRIEMSPDGGLARGESAYNSAWGMKKIIVVAVEMCYIRGYLCTYPFFHLLRPPFLGLLSDLQGLDAKPRAPVLCCESGASMPRLPGYAAAPSNQWASPSASRRDSVRHHPATIRAPDDVDASSIKRLSGTTMTGQLRVRAGDNVVTPVLL